MRPIRRTVAVWILSMAVIGITPGLALATPGWSSPGPVGLPSGVLAPSIGYATGGAETVAYVEITSQSPLATAVHVGVIAPGGAYVNQLTIPSTATALPASVSLSEAPDGAAVIGYGTIASTAPTSNAGFYAMERPADSSSWGDLTTVSPVAARDGAHASEAVTAIAADGTAAVGVEHTDPTVPGPGGGDRIDVAVASRTGVWGNPTEISVSGEDNESLALAFDSSDNLTAGFSSALPDTTPRPTAEIATRAGSAGVWGAPLQVSAYSPTDFLGSQPHLGVAPDGSAVVAYQLVTAGHTLDTWATTRAGANGGWTAPVDLTPGSTSAAPEAVGVSPSDKAYVVYDYQGSNSAFNCVGVVRANVGGAFTAPACASALNYQPFGIVGVAFLGNDAYFAFTGEPNGGSADDLEGDRWADTSAAADSPTTVAPLETPVPLLGQILPDQDGGVPVFFTPNSDSGGVLEASAWDTGGPNLTASAVPSTAVAGQPVTLGANFTDLWSDPVTSPSWSFGDGTSASGASVSHTYATAGTYAVDAVTADALGNTTTTPFTITVTAAPATTTTPTSTSTPTSTPTPASTTPPTDTTTTPASTTPAATAVVAPKLSALKQTHTSWLEQKRTHAKGKQPAVGTVFHFTLSQASTVTVTFTGTRTGRRAGKKCMAETHGNAKRAKCARHFSEAETITGRRGVSALSFRGAVTGHAKLAAGKYTVTFAAHSGTLRSGISTLHFTILRP